MAQFHSSVRGFYYVDPYLFATWAGDLLSRFTRVHPGVVGKVSFTALIKPHLSESDLRLAEVANSERRFFVQDFTSDNPGRIIREAWEKGLKPHQIILVHHIVRMSRVYAHVAHSRTVVTDDERLTTVVRMFGFRCINSVEFGNLTKIQGETVASETSSPLEESKQENEAEPPDALGEGEIASDGGIELNRQHREESLTLPNDIGMHHAGDPEKIAKYFEPRLRVERLLYFWLAAFVILMFWLAWQHRGWAERWPMWFFVLVCGLACAVGGSALFLVRCKFRSGYGLLEVCCGAISVGIAFQKNQSGAPVDLALTIQYVTSLYIVVRGIDNIDNGYRPKWMNERWKAIFKKTGW